VSGTLITVLTDAGSTVLLLAFGYVIVKMLLTRLAEVNERQQRLFDRMLRAWGLPPEEPPPVKNGEGRP
jgi:hypothetical protein